MGCIASREENAELVPIMEEFNGLCILTNTAGYEVAPTTVQTINYAKRLVAHRSPMSTLRANLVGTLNGEISYAKLLKKFLLKTENARAIASDLTRDDLPYLDSIVNAVNKANT